MFIATSNVWSDLFSTWGALLDNTSRGGAGANHGRGMFRLYVPALQLLGIDSVGVSTGNNNT